jgi:hypothetical protein
MFSSICGVVVGRDVHHYRCRVVDFYEGHRKTKTAVHFPDQTIRLRWQDGRNVKVHMEGMEIQHTQYTVLEGETNFTLGEQSYFYVSDKNAAQLEVQHFRE